MGNREQMKEDASAIHGIRSMLAEMYNEVVTLTEEARETTVPMILCGIILQAKASAVGAIAVVDKMIAEAGEGEDISYYDAMKKAFMTSDTVTAVFVADEFRKATDNRRDAGRMQTLALGFTKVLSQCEDEMRRKLTMQEIKGLSEFMSGLITADGRVNITMLECEASHAHLLCGRGVEKGEVSRVLFLDDEILPAITAAYAAYAAEEKRKQEPVPGLNVGNLFAANNEAVDRMILSELEKSVDRTVGKEPEAGRGMVRP